MASKEPFRCPSKHTANPQLRAPDRHSRVRMSTVGITHVRLNRNYPSSERIMAKSESKITCGLVMPISAIDGCSQEHWSEVLEILNEAIEEAGFVANLVSNADDVGIIQKRIIQNLYENPVVVCDVSAKNPNVMFELGLRLAFDKPTVIVKDDKTSYSFDTAPIEHVEYPRDLRFAAIVDFKSKLASKIKATHQKATTDQTYTTFLKHFGEFTVAKLDQKEISAQEAILEELQEMRVTMRRIESGRTERHFKGREDLDICLGHKQAVDAEKALSDVLMHPGVIQANVREVSRNHFHLVADFVPGADIDRLRSELESRFSGRIRRSRTPVAERPKVARRRTKE